MKRYALLAALVVLGLSGMWGASAQQAAVDTVTVPLGSFDFDLNGNEALTACVVERSESLEGIFVRLQTFIRLESGDVVPSVAFTTRATGALETAHVEACFILTPEPEPANG